MIFGAIWFGIIGFFYYKGWVGIDCVRLFVPAFLVSLMGFWEDRKGLSSVCRLIIQVCCAAGALLILLENGSMLYAWLPPIIPWPVCFGLLIFIIVWMTNLYNFMDGSDGLAASQGIFIFGVGGFLLFQYQATELGILAWSMAALLSGFLIWNWPTARIFMGDSGSYLLGFLTAIFAIVSIKYYDMPWIIWVLLTAFFWFDASITLIRRIIARQPWSQPHRLHAYQRLIQARWSHQSVLLWSIFLNTILSGLALMVHYDPRLMQFAVGAALVLLVCAYLLVEILKPMLKTWHTVHNEIPAPVNIDP